MKSRKLLVLLICGILFGILLINSFNLTLNPKTSVYEPDFLNNEPDSLLSAEVTKNNLVGVGNNVPVGLFTNISSEIPIDTPALEVPGYKFFDLPMNTNHQNITQTNLTFSGINAQNVTFIIEENPEYFLTSASLPWFPVWGAMSLRIPTSCKLKQVQLFLQETNLNAKWNLTIYNATRDLVRDLQVIPHMPTGISVLQNATDAVSSYAAHWQNFTFPDVQLNMTNTYMDANGFAYYFVIALLPIYNPIIISEVSIWYYEYDDIYLEDGWAYTGTSLTGVYSAVDYCMRVVLAPLLSTPSPSDVGISIKNPIRPPPTNLTTESNYSSPVAAAYNITDGAIILAQNFTLTDFSTIHDISIYLKNYGNASVTFLGILPDNESGFGPYWDGNLLFDINYTIFFSETTEGWFNCTMIDKPNLAPGNYWWVLLVESVNNVTLYGSSDAVGDNAVALNITVSVSGYDASFYPEILPYDFASIIYYQPDIDYYTVNQSWIFNERLIPDIFGYYHYEILTRWYGQTTFDVACNLELENNVEAIPFYHTNYVDSSIWWDITFVPTFPTSNLGKVINITLPLDWTVSNVTRNGFDHGVSNWSLYSIGNQNMLSIYNASEYSWTIWSNSTIYPVDYNIEKYVGGQFQVASNATVYDRIRVNVTIANQINGDCVLTIFYPDDETSFTNQTQITTETALLSWYPENDSAATGGNYSFLVHWTNGTEVGFNRQYFLFNPIPTNLTIASATPTPYVNDTTKTINIRYFDTRGVNITGATLSPDLNGIALEWEDLYSKSLNPQDRGIYRIKLDTNGLNAGQSYTLNAWAYRDGYENVTLQPHLISILPVPTSMTTNVQNLTQYSNERISFSCSFKDTFHKSDIDWAQVNYTIVGTSISGQMTSIMPGESVYIAENVQLTNLPGRVLPYQINITANATDCYPQSKIITLYVLNKTITSLSLNIGDGPYIQGSKLNIEATLLNTSSGFGIPTATIRFTFGDIILDQIAFTDANGIAKIEIVIPNTPFTIQAIYDGTTSTTNRTASTTEITVITYLDIGLYIGIIVGACVAGVIAIRQLYIVPKRNRKLKEYQKIAQKFQDVANLRHVLVLHKESSSCIFQQSFGESLDGDLISGFLTAISSFQDEFKPEKIALKERKTGGFELLYQDYKIFLFTGALASIALIVEESPSEAFRKQATELVQAYENVYHKVLSEFRGNLAPFKDSYRIIAEKLELSLVWPHQLNRPMSISNLPSTQGALINIADTTMRSQATQYFFLPLIISIGQAGQPQAKLEIIAAAYTLHKMKIFEAINPMGS